MLTATIYALVLVPYIIGCFAGQYDAKRAARHKPVSFKETIIDEAGTA